MRRVSSLNWFRFAIFYDSVRIAKPKCAGRPLLTKGRSNATLD
jgi:hypothetical protein